MGMVNRERSSVLLYPHVLVLDDDVELCELLAIRLESRGYRVTSAPEEAAAYASLEREKVDVVLLDLRLGRVDGLDVLVNLEARAPGVPVIVLTAHGSIETAVEAMRRGAYGFMTKPFDHEELLEKLARAVEERSVKPSMRRPREPEGIGRPELCLLGSSPPIEQLRRLIVRLGATDTTILITGESGTGKELVARSLHLVSSRRNQPFIPVNCGALSPELLTSELFGHVRGAFTGATRDREGLFGAARGGTLFLDEIGEASPDVQVRLLRVLQEQRYTPVGTTVERSADVRIIAATNRDLHAEVREKRFRSDLFYRLHVMPLNMPPLRERADDIGLLAETFLERAAARHGVAPPRPTREALEFLRTYTWPGNVRQLMHVMEAAVLLAPRNFIDVELLQALITGPSDTDAARAAQGPPESADTGSAGPSPSSGGAEQRVRPEDAGEASRLLASWLYAKELPPFTQVRREFERMYLTEVLRRAGGNITVAAKMAGRHRTDFYELLRRHNLNRDNFR